jgi:2-polyprenyl-6-methoxyphenol hydroxylase-like FAD-dependent oxidoreductase
MTNTPEVPVLIVGAGPSGLVLALWLTRLGIRVRIIDKTAEPGTTSRALAIAARTLELYSQVDLADAVVAGAARVSSANFWVGGKRAAHLALGPIGEGRTRYPFVLMFPQDEHEKLLIERLTALGVQVERRTELIRIDNRSDSVIATIKLPGGSEEICNASYVAGCDGAHSIVRESLNIGFPGGTYSSLFYVADIEGSGPPVNGEINLELDAADFLAIFPLKREGHIRLIGSVRIDPANPKKEFAFSDVGQRAIEHMQLGVKRVNWFSTYHVHHRVAAKFRQGRAFLVGDAAHIHSPVGGQGMNTGIGDAVNLSWKLAHVLKGNISDSVLDTYEVERIAFARRLVATTDRVFTFVTKPGNLARFVRTRIAPAIFPPVTSTGAVRRFLFRTISQTGIEYRSSKLSEGAVGKIHGGDRLPWVQLADGRDNYESLKSLAWQVHVYGAPRRGVKETCSSLHLPLQIFQWTTEAERAGFTRSAVYVVRPDGYVAIADEGAAPQKWSEYFNRRGIRSDSTA